MATAVYKATKEGKDIKIKLDLPIGTIYENRFNINIEDYFMGTWERYGNGEVLVGVDENDATFNIADLSIGEKTHTLTIHEMPSHSHSLYRVPEALTEDKQLAFNWGSEYQRFQGMVNNTGLEGGGQAHNNIQPSRTIYRWVRVA